MTSRLHMVPQNICASLIYLTIVKSEEGFSDDTMVNFGYVIWERDSFVPEEA